MDVYMQSDIDELNVLTRWARNFTLIAWKWLVPGTGSSVSINLLPLIQLI
jgi:hypothetical protein